MAVLQAAFDGDQWARREPAGEVEAVDRGRVFRQGVLQHEVGHRLARRPGVAAHQEVLAHRTEAERG
jgi:hypothetical protein